MTFQIPEKYGHHWGAGRATLPEIIDKSLKDSDLPARLGIYRRLCVWHIACSIANRANTSPVFKNRSQLVRSSECRPNTRRWRGKLTFPSFFLLPTRLPETVLYLFRFQAAGSPAAAHLESKLIHSHSLFYHS